MVGQQFAQNDNMFTFKPLTAADLPLLHDWLNRPHIAERWDGAISLRETRKKYLSRVDSHLVSFYIAWLNDEPIGFGQSYLADKLDDHVWPNDCREGTVGIDYFLADPNRLGQGLGSRMVAQFCQMLFADPAICKLICDPSPENGPSIGCLRKVGFVEIGLIETPDGPALAMELARIG